MHSHVHAFPGIKEQGVTRNYNTKIFETMHGPIKDIYHAVGNQKNIEERVNNLIHFTLVILLKSI
jgi:hypothetical protein